MSMYQDRYEWISNPYEFGGRDPDISQMFSSLTALIREAYPINQVPEPIAAIVEELKGDCMALEARIKGLIERVSDDVAPGTGLAAVYARITNEHDTQKESSNS